MPPALSTADLLAFNDELSALVAAGLPLPQGLAGLVRRRGALGQLAERLQTRLQQGESLTAALEQERPAVPAEYAAVVRAGERAGRLPVALHSLATLGSEMLQIRRLLATALRPALLVLLVAYVLTMLVGADLVRRYLQTFDDFGLATTGPTWWLARLALALERLWWLPLVGLAGLAWGWWRSAETGLVSLSGWAHWFRWLPGASALLRNLQYSAFARLLSTLVSQQVPFPEALRLAGQAVGDQRMRARAEHLAQATEQGSGDVAPGQWPAYLDWTLRHGQRSPGLPALLAHAGDVYERRAQQRALWLRVLWPSLATLVLGGGLVLVYGWVTFGPLVELWTGLEGMP